jgi:RNA polymerase sigma factor (sigma-70 family)
MGSNRGDLSSMTSVLGTPVTPVIHVVDDDADVRDAVSRVLRSAGYEVETYATAQQLLDRLPDNSEPGCLLLDVRIPGLSGPDLQDRLVARGSLLPIIFLTGNGDIPTSVQTIKAGAEDFLTKPVSGATLIDAIERALAHQRERRKRDGELNVMRSRVNALTAREREVFELVVQGKMNKQIAAALGITERTIKAHRQKVMKKIKVQSVAELVWFAKRLSWRASPPKA